MSETVLAYIPSPPQGVWQIGVFPVRAYAICILVGVIAAVYLGEKRWVELKGGTPGQVIDVAIWAVPFGVIGGRLYHLATDWSTYFGKNGLGWKAALKIQDGGLGIWGAVAFGALGAAIGCKRKRINLKDFADAVAPGIVLAQAIGRLGNYFNQELYGGTTKLPWGLEIFARKNEQGIVGSHIIDGISTGKVVEIVQPTFLYELLWDLLIFFFLLWAEKRFCLKNGRLFASYVAGYCFGRFWIEMLRSDYATTLFGIRINVFTSFVCCSLACLYLLVTHKSDSVK